MRPDVFTCGRVRAGHVVGQRAWDDLCFVHGVGTDWFRALPRLPFGYVGERHTTRAEWLSFRQGLPQNRGPARNPSPGLARALGRCHDCQDWYREFAQENSLPSVTCVGSLGDGADPVTAAAVISAVLGIETGSLGPDPSDALATLTEHAESRGFLILASGEAGHGQPLTLDPGEFRSITLTDRRAPLVFLNSAAAEPAALTRSLLHALAHLWIGESSIDHDGPDSGASGESERWCSGVAGEILLPARRDAAGRDARRLARELRGNDGLLRRLGGVPAPAGQAHLPAGRWLGFRGAGTASHVSPALVTAIAASAAEGVTLYRDAFRMLGVAGQSAFDELAAASPEIG